MTLKDINIDWPLVGNGHIADFLLKCLKKGDVSGPYIFCGPDNLGKTAVALFFAQVLLCQSGKSKLPCGECYSCKKFSAPKSGDEEMAHGDFYLVKKDKSKKNISVEQIRGLITTLGMSSFLNSYKIGIIKHAHNLSGEAANALLKTLEEPKKDVIIILVTSSPETLPATILSRGKILRFKPVSADIIYDYLIEKRGAGRSAAKNYSRMCLGRPALAVKFLEDADFYNSYLKRAGVFINFFKDDINSRFLAIEELLKESGYKTSEQTNQESAALTIRVAEIWLGVARDLLLLSYGQGNLIQHEIFTKELDVLKEKLGRKKIFSLFESLSTVEKYIKANVNSRLALEVVALNT
jgi:DNA polymerase III gamma/tau subunit